MNRSKNEAIRQRDLAVLWHPTTQMKDHEWLPLLPVSSGQGVISLMAEVAMGGIDLATKD